MKAQMATNVIELHTTDPEQLLRELWDVILVHLSPQLRVTLHGSTLTLWQIDGILRLPENERIAAATKLIAERKRKNKSEGLKATAEASRNLGLYADLVSVPRRKTGKS